MRRPQVLYVGDRDWPEFAGPVRWLHDNVDVSFATDVSSACAVAASREAPLGIIVIAACRPGEQKHAELERLRRQAPLTPIVCLLGSFCEGEIRTGTPWPGAVRVYAHQFVARMGTQLERLASEGTTDWAPPFTATDEDRLLASPPVGVSSVSARVAVISRQREAASALCDALQVAGYFATSHRDDPTGFNGQADVIVWDCAAGFTSSSASFDRLVRHTPQTPKIVVIGFPRAEEIDAAIAHGATAVVSKPFLVQDLLWLLQECLENVAIAR